MSGAGRAGISPQKTRPEGLLERLEFGIVLLGEVAEDLDRACYAAKKHTPDAVKPMRLSATLARRAARQAREAIERLASGTAPIADGYSRARR